MAVLNIRNLPDHVHAQLRIRAAKAGRSMEAEARVILTAACMAPEPVVPATELQDWVDEIYGARKPANVVDTFIAERREEDSRP